jgi:hypothetical protein
VSALKISFGMHFGKSPQHEASSWGHSFHPSASIANMATFPQQSAFSCSTTIDPSGPEFEDLGGGRKRKGAGLYLLVNVGRRAPPLAFRYGEKFAVRGCAPQIGDCQKKGHDQRAQFQRVP